MKLLAVEIPLWKIILALLILAACLLVIGLGQIVHAAGAPTPIMLEPTAPPPEPPPTPIPPDVVTPLPPGQPDPTVITPISTPVPPDDAATPGFEVLLSLASMGAAMAAKGRGR